MYKKVLSIILVLTLLVSPVLQVAQAGDDSTVEIANFLESSVITEEAATNIALNHIRSFSGDATLEVRRVDSMYDLEDNITGYCVSFKKKHNNDFVPSGYVVISKLEAENPIVEFSPEGASLTEELNIFAKNFNKDHNEFSSKNKKGNHMRKIYFLGSGKVLCDYTENCEEIFDPNTLEVLSKKEYKRSAKALVQHKIKKIKGKRNAICTFLNSDSSTVAGGMTDQPTGGINHRSNRLPGITMSHYRNMSEFKSGNVCAPTAATNLMIYYRRAKNKTNILVGDSEIQTFNRFFNLMGTSVTEGTPDSNRVPAYNSYIKERGYSSSAKVDEYWLNLWSDFTRDIDAGIPIHTSLKADNGGHAVVTVGWYIVRYGAKDFKYLQVINGWQKSIKYAGFDGYYNKILGIAVKI